jgi:hypothetical protein
MNKEILIQSLNKRARGFNEPSDVQNQEKTYSGLELSDVIYKELSFFIKNDTNTIFRKMKSETYFANVKKDILETGCILNPLIAMPSGLLIEGETRLLIAEQLFSEGYSTFERIPVRLILSSLDEAEQKRRLILGNLSRFEIDENTRLLLYSEIWPEYFSQKLRAGRPKNTDTVSAFSPLTSQITETGGISERQLEREKKVFLAATSIAQAQGRNKPELNDLEQAREVSKSERRKITAKQSVSNLRKNIKTDSTSIAIIKLVLSSLSSIETLKNKDDHIIEYEKINTTIEKLLNNILGINGIDSESIKLIQEYKTNSNEDSSNGETSFGLRE